jgi:hypothetical protein
MRKSVGSIILALLLLALPVFANAFTLTVKIQGPTDGNGNKVNVAWTEVANPGNVDLTTTQNFYLTDGKDATVAYTVAVGYDISVKVNAAAAVKAAYGTTPASNVFNAGTNVVTVIYTPHVIDNSITLNQSAGGSVLARLPGKMILGVDQGNGIWTTGDAVNHAVAGAVVGQVFPIKIAPSTDYSVVSYTINGGTPVTVNGAAGVAYADTLTVQASPAVNSVSAVFVKVANLSASLLIPVSGITGNQVAASLTTNTNDGTLSYVWTVTGSTPAPAITGQGNSAITFTPAQAATYHVSVVVSSINKPAGFPVIAGDVVIADAAQMSVASCTSCHSQSNSAIVNAFNGSVHNGPAGSTCVACHNAVPHNAGVYEPNINAASFVVVSSAANGVAKGAVYCTKCHASETAFTTGSHKNTVTGCATCHISGGAVTDAHAVKTLANVAVPNQAQCVACHTGEAANIAAAGSVHSQVATCATCHSAAGVNHGAAAIPTCDKCHTAAGSAPLTGSHLIVDPTRCASCHDPLKNTHLITVAAGTVKQPVQADCVICHATRVASFTGSVHFNGSATNPNTKHECGFCHTNPNADGLHGYKPVCTQCHAQAIADGFAAGMTASGDLCKTCHGGSGHPHGLNVTTVADAAADCITCHASAVAHPGAVVADNNGVRKITGSGGEFQQWSHHIINDVNNAKDPIAAQCALCHMEGKTNGTGKVLVDPAYHVADAYVHLRDGNTGLKQSESSNGEFVWNPASPNHKAMDQFCMSCHNADGAVTAVADIPLGTLSISGQPIVQSALNPFADKIQNNYDGLFRNAVVPVFDQFDPSNTSHHAVRAARYTATTSNDVNGVTAGNPTGKITAFASISANNASLGYKNLRYLNGTSYVGTMSDTGKFATAYKPLVNNNGAMSLITDASQIHCGDCHTVGQWAARGTVEFKSYSAAYGAGVTKYYKQAIGAHGSGNEYMLRNNNGDNTLNPMALVCYNCHAATLYGSGSTSTATRIKVQVSGIYANGLPNDTLNGAPNGAMADKTQWKLYNYTSATRTFGPYAGGFGLLFNGTETAAMSYSNFALKTPAALTSTATAHDGVAGTLQSVHCNDDQNNTAGLTGLARLNSSNKQFNSFMSYTSGHYNAGGANAFGIKCANCHNSGDGTYPGYGGIHGNAFRVSDTRQGGINQSVVKNAAYTTYSSQTGTYKIDNVNNLPKTVSHQPYRFLPGLGNFRYNGGSDWSLKQVSTKATSVGCYTLSGTSTSTAAPTYPKGSTRFTNAANVAAGRVNFVADDNGLLGTWGACTDHAGNDHGPARNVLRPTQY